MPIVGFLAVTSFPAGLLALLLVMIAIGASATKPADHSLQERLRKSKPVALAAYPQEQSPEGGEAECGGVLQNVIVLFVATFAVFLTAAVVA